MKKLLFIALMALFAGVAIWADNQADFSKNVESYNHQMSASQYQAAAKSIARASQACVSVKNYDGAFKLLINMDRQLQAKGVTADSLPGVFYTLAKARFDIYSAMGNTGSAQTWLTKMVSLADKSGRRELIDEMLFSAAQYYYSVNQPVKGDQCISRLIKQFDGARDYKAADTAYKQIIAKAVGSNDAVLVEHTYENYMRWSDSIDAIQADAELDTVRSEYAASQQTIAEKDKTIRGKSGLIATFLVLFIASLAMLGVGVWFYMRVVAKNRRMKRHVEVANEQSAAKSALLSNMAAQVEPTLEKLPQDNPAVQNLRGYVRRVGELSEVGSKEPVDPEQIEDVNLEPFCASIADEVKPQLAPGVKLHVEGARGMAHIDGPEVRKILLHLMENAAKYTPADGRVTLEYKKRGAKCHQFVVSDSGPGIPADKRDTLFTAFSTTTDLAEGDGLGLPICALRAEKLGGTLELEGNHAHGATFVLTIRS